MKKTNTIATLVFHVNRRISLWVHARRLEAERAEAKLARSIEASLESDPRDATLGHDRSEMTAVDLRSLDRRRRWVEFKELCREIAEHPRFNTFFLFLICLNTATMAVEHHGMDDTLAFGSVVANACFTAFFFLEVSVKVLGLGAWHFFGDAFNRFDFLIVSLAVVETVAVAVTGGYDPSGMNDDDSNDDSNDSLVSALRGLKVLRAFRVFKMFRYVSSLRVIGEVLLSSLSSFTSIAALLCLFTVVFRHPRFARVRGHEHRPREPLCVRRGRSVAGRPRRVRHLLPQFISRVPGAHLGGLGVHHVQERDVRGVVRLGVLRVLGDRGKVHVPHAVPRGHHGGVRKQVRRARRRRSQSRRRAGEDEARARRRRFAELRRRKKEKERRRLHLLEKQTTDGDDTGETGGKLALTTVSVVGGERLPETFFKTSSEASSGRRFTKKKRLKKRRRRSLLGQRKRTYGLGVHERVRVPRLAVQRELHPGRFRGVRLAAFGFLRLGLDHAAGARGGAATPSLRWNAAGLDGLESVVGSARPSGFQASSSSMMVAHSRRAAGRANKAADLAEWSCFCVPPHHKWREAAYDLVKHEAFERVMFLLIGVQCVVMALERPGMEKSLERTLKRVDLALAVCFALEVSLKSFAFGLRRFLRERVNRLDLCIVLFAILEICLTSAGGLGAIRSLRILRAIRPLRALTKSPGMRMVLKSVALSVGAMANVSAVLLLVFVVFGILGVQIFAGRFYRCDDPTVPNKAACVGTYVHPVTGITLQRTWANAYLNFDSLPDALVSLFVASTLDGYGQLLFDGLDATGVDEQPKRDANPGAFFFFLAFIVLCAFALLNLYVGVIFYQFSRIRTLSQTSSLDLTEAQKEWGEMCRTVLRMRRRKKMPLPANPLRRIPYRVASHEKFENGVFLALIAAAAVTATRTRDELPYVTDAREHAEVFFFVVFACEALLKCTAVGFKEYWREPWNRFDFACVALSALDVFFRAAFLGTSDGEKAFAFDYGHDAFEHHHDDGHYDSGHTNDTHYENALRKRYDYDAYVYRLAGPETARRTAERFLGLAKVARLVRLVKHLKGLRDLLETLVASLPAFWNVGALVALLFFIYAYVGVILFGTTPRTNTSDGAARRRARKLRVLPARRADAVPRCDQRRVGGGDARLRRRRGHRPRRVPVLRELRGAGVDGDAQPVHRGDHRELRELPGPRALEGIAQRAPAVRRRLPQVRRRLGNRARRRPRADVARDPSAAGAGGRERKPPDAHREHDQKSRERSRGDRSRSHENKNARERPTERRRVRFHARGALHQITQRPTGRARPRAVPADGVRAGSPGVRVRHAPGRDARRAGARRAPRVPGPLGAHPGRDELGRAHVRRARAEALARARRRARRRRQEAAGFGGKGGERPSASLGRRRPDGVSVPARLPGRRESAGERHRGGRPRAERERARVRRPVSARKRRRRRRERNRSRRRDGSD